MRMRFDLSLRGEHMAPKEKVKSGKWDESSQKD